MSEEDPKPDAGPNAGPKRTGAPPFVKGRSGNPRGKRKGTRHKRTLLLAAMSEDDRGAIFDKIIRQAKRGCKASQRLIADRLEPPRRGSPVRFPLGPLVTVSDIVSAQASIAKAMAAGVLTPTEAQEVSGVVELHRRAIETSQMEARLAAIETMMEKKDHDQKL